VREIQALFLSCVVAFGFSSPSAAQNRPTRLALVVGAGSYFSWDTLSNATRDAELIAQTLHERLGFTLVDGAPLLNPDKRHLELAIRHFGDSLGPGTVALFYYAGHGTRHSSQTFLVPVDANRPATSESYGNQFIGVDDRVLYQMQKNHASGLNIIVVDACRDELPISDAPRTISDRIGGTNNHIASRGGGSHDLAQGQSAADPLGPDLSGGTIIVYSTEVNNKASDGLRGSHSPFATAFVDTIIKPGMEIRDVFNEIGSSVQNSSVSGTIHQIPWVSQSPITQRFYLGGQPAIDPRKELAAMRYSWDIKDFFDAIERRDYRAVELFLISGMKMNDVAPGTSDFKIFLYKNYFDLKIASLILYYNAIDPDIACPVPPNSMYANYKFYTEIPSVPKLSTFVLEVCRQESVRKSFDAALENLKKDADAEATRKARSQEYQRRNSARPMTDADIAMDRASKGLMRRYEMEMGAELESSQTQLAGWTQARRLLWGAP
jgi:uncharacterized caspase-like protein